MPVILAILGLILGAVANEFSGALIGAGVGWLLARSIQQRREIEALRQRLDSASPAKAATSVNPPATEAVAAPHSPPVVAPAPPTAETAATASDPPAPLPADTVPDVQAFAKRPPAWLDRLRDWAFGGNTVVKLGVALLFLGLAFLARYASEQFDAPIELRLAAIAAVALGLLAVGWRLRERRAGYAQVLQGGGIAVLYLVLFVAFKTYGLLGAGTAFALMAVVALLSAALAVLQDSRALAVVGALGGYATPLLVSTGSGNHVGLFGYYLLLTLGIAAVAWFRTWKLLNLIGFIFVFGVGTVWGVLAYRPEHYLSAQGFLIAFVLVFVAILLAPARRLEAQDPADPPAATGERWLNGSLLFGLPTLAFGLQYGLVRDTAYGPAISAAVAAAFYIALATALRGRPRLTLAFEGCLAVGTVLLTLVIPLALDSRATAGAWALEGAGLLWLGWRQQRRLARGLGYGLLVIAGGLLAVSVERFGPPAAWLNPSLIAAAMVTGGGLLAAWVSKRWHDAATVLPGERWAEPLLLAWALLALLMATVLHVRALVPGEQWLAAYVGVGSVVAIGLAALARRLGWSTAALPALALAPGLLLAGLASAVEFEHPFQHGGALAWPLAVSALVATLKLASPLWPDRGRHLAHAGMALVLALLAALLGRGVLRAGGDAGSAWPWLGWMAAPALLLVALPRASERSPWPVRERPLAWSQAAGAVIAASLLGWVLLACGVSRGDASPLPYLPLLNPLDIGIALALLAVLQWCRSGAGHGLLARSAGDGSAAAPLPSWVPAVIGGCGFVWLNAMLVHAFHHLADVPFRVSAWTASLPVQTGLTLLWSGTALVLMWASARRRQRAPWMVGAALLAVVTLKLLLVDLSASGTVTRIVSFIGAGVLMLVIGFVAPLPGKQESPDAKA
jgi:uncharacterized membrane protein